jgi:hypothetical protein
MLISQRSSATNVPERRDLAASDVGCYVRGGFLCMQPQWPYHNAPLNVIACLKQPRGYVTPPVVRRSSVFNETSGTESLFPTIYWINAMQTLSNDDVTITSLLDGDATSNISWVQHIVYSTV